MRWLALVVPAVVAVFVTSAGACSTAELKDPGSSSGNTSGGPDPDDSGVPVVVEGGRDPSADLEGGVIPKSINVTIQVEPTDNGAAVEAAIRAAKTSVHMTMYLLTDPKVMDALGDLKDAGKDVKVVLNKTFPPNGGDNSPAYATLKGRGVNVVYAPAAYTFTHEKAVIIDNAKVLIMTMNLTQTNDNREFIATDGDTADVADAEKLFAADFAGNSVTVASSKLVMSPPAASPVDARSRLIALVDSAKTSLDVEVQSLSDTALTDAIIRAHQAKVAVRVVISGAPGASAGEQAATAKLKAAGVPIKGVVVPYIHAKAIVVDGATVFVGSQNFTLTALVANRELGVVTDAPAEVAKVDAIIAQDFAAGTTP